MKKGSYLLMLHLSREDKEGSYKYIIYTGLYGQGFFGVNVTCFIRLGLLYKRIVCDGLHGPVMFYVCVFMMCIK